jgi:hypothetical protein
MPATATASLKFVQNSVQHGTFRASGAAFSNSMNYPLATPPKSWLKKLAQLRAKRLKAAEREHYETVDQFARQIRKMQSFARLKGWKVPCDE